MLKGTQVRITRDITNAKTGKIWIWRGQRGTLIDENYDENAGCTMYIVKLDNGLFINFTRKSIMPVGVKVV